MNFYPYSTHYFPAAPVVQVTLGSPGAAPSLGPFEALIDTGADGTMIPITYLREVRATKVDQAILRSQWGERRTITMYAISLTIGTTTLSAVSVIGDTIGDELILGRNVINRLRLLLDGQAAMVEILDA